MHTPVLVADDREIYQVLDRFLLSDHREPTRDSKWDYAAISKQDADAMPLKRPRQLRRFFGLLSAGTTTRAWIAKKYEVDQQAFLADPPAALVFRDRLYECPILPDRGALANWHTEFRQRFTEIPEDTTLQIVDAHS